jgi:hypothetical protein
MHANPQRPCLRWTALALLATSTLLSGGCAKFFHEWHYNPVTRSLHDHRLSYYQSPHTGRIIPKEHHAMPMVEFPCFGYESTCWHRWPQECGPCPVQSADSMVLGGPYHGQHLIEEVIAQPPAETENSQQPTGDEPMGDVPSRDALPDDTLPGDALPDDDRPGGTLLDDPLSSPVPGEEESLLPRGPDDAFDDTSLPGDGVQRTEVPSAEYGSTDQPQPGSQPDFGPSETDEMTSIENQFLTEPSAGNEAAESVREPESRTSAAAAEPTHRVARRSSRRVRRPVEPAPSETSRRTPAGTLPGEVDPFEAVRPSAPNRESAAPVTTRPVAAQPVIATRSNTPSRAIAAVHRTSSSRRLAPASSGLPSFAIVPIFASPESNVLIPMQMQAGADNTLRFLSDAPPSEVRVADQTGTETSLRFR